MKKVAVSVITPAYKCATTIKETYDSICRQSFSNWEWIVVEDNSNDGTFEYIKEMVKHDGRVIVLQTDHNSGAAVARNLGIEKASGQYIAFLDADDLWKKDKLEHQIEFMKKNNYAFTFTDYDLLYDNGKIKTYKTKKNKETYKTLLKRNAIGCLTVIYDTKTLGKVYMPIDCIKREDHGAWLDITRNGTYAYKLNESLSIYRIGAGSVSSNKIKMLKYQYYVYRNHEKFNSVKSLWYLIICSFNKIRKKY